MYAELNKEQDLISTDEGQGTPPDQGVISADTAKDFDDALAGVNPIVKTALLTTGDRPLPVPQGISKESIPDQIFKLDFAARLLQSLSNATTLSEQVRANYLSMVHKIMMMIITLSILITTQSESERRLSMEGPALKKLKFAYKVKLEQEGETSEMTDHFDIEKAILHVLQSKQEQLRFGIPNLEDFFADLIGEGYGGDLLKCMAEIPRDFHEKIIIKCLDKASKNRRVEYTESAMLGQVIGLIDTGITCSSKAIIKKLQHTQTEIGFSCSVRALLLDPSSEEEIVTLTKKTKKIQERSPLDLILLEVLKLNDEVKKKLMLVKILKHHQAIIATFGKTLHPETSLALYDYSSDWPDFLRDEVEFSPEVLDLLKSLEASYDEMIDTLNNFGFKEQKIPSKMAVMNAIKNLKTWQLENILSYFYKPMICITPAGSFAEKVIAINEHKKMPNQNDTLLSDGVLSASDPLWGPDIAKMVVTVVDGANAFPDFNFDINRMNLGQVINKFKKEYAKRGLAIMSSHEGMMLMMQSLKNGQPIDNFESTNTLTHYNLSPLSKKEEAIYGSWDSIRNCVRLSSTFLSHRNIHVLSWVRCRPSLAVLVA